jgi:hypothetical protein
MAMTHLLRQSPLWAAGLASGRRGPWPCLDRNVFGGLYQITNDKANLFYNAGWPRIDAEERGLLDAANCRAMFCHSDWYRDLIARSFCWPAAR